MNRKLGKFLISLSLAVVMCLGMATTAFAAGNPIYGTETAPAQAAITKQLNMPLYTTTPTCDFTFVVTPVSYNDSTAAEEVAKVPAINGKAISFTSADNTDINTSDSIKSVAKEVNLFSGVNFPYAGVYTYTIKENANTFTAGANEKMTYSTGEYTVNVYVKDKANPANGRYIAAIGVLVVKPGAPGQAGGDKVDPTPGGDPTVTGDFSKLVFNNSFAKWKPTDPDKPDPNDPATYGVMISKTVTGDYGDHTKKFSMSINVAKPTVEAASNTTFKGYLYSAAGVKGSVISFTYGTAKTVEIAHGEKLVLTDVYVGSTYKVTETGVAGYTPSAVIKTGGTDATKSAAVGASLSTGDAEIVKEAANGVAFTNKFKDITPTGIIVNNLPFIMLFVVAIGGFAATVIVKSRKRKTFYN